MNRFLMSMMQEIIAGFVDISILNQTFSSDEHFTTVWNALVLFFVF